MSDFKFGSNSNDSIKDILKRDKSSIREKLLESEFKRDSSKACFIRLSDGKEFDRLPLDRILSGD